jgi:subtilisin family serine protease
MKKIALKSVNIFLFSLGLSGLGQYETWATDAKNSSTLAPNHGLQKIYGGEKVIIRKQLKTKSSNSNTPREVTVGNTGQTLKITRDELILSIDGSDTGNVFAPINQLGTNFIAPTNSPSSPHRKVQPSVIDEINRAGSADVIIRSSIPDRFYGNGLRSDDYQNKNRNFQYVRTAIEKILNPKSAIRKNLRLINGFAANIDMDGLKALEKSSHVKEIRYDTKVFALLDTSTQQIHAPDAWSMTDSSSFSLTGKGRTIAVIDTGVDYTHPDLGGCMGVGCKVVGGYDFVNNDSNPMDDHGHGTHCAATAAGIGIYPGVAPGANIYAIKVLNTFGFGSTSDVVLGIEKAMDPDGNGDTSDHVDIISMSLGAFGTPDDDASQAVDNATAVGVTSAIAAGNNGPSNYTVQSPGVAATAITVAAACKPDQIGVDARCTQPIASFSSRGPVLTSQGTDLHKPDISAPGVMICAARWGTSFGGEPTCLDNNHVRISGTSMATPHVAGAIAILKQAQPSLTPAQIKQTLIENAQTLNMDVNAQGAGIINVENSVFATGFEPAISVQPTYATIVLNPTTQTDTQSIEINVTGVTVGSETLTPHLSSPIAGVTFSADPLSIDLNGNNTVSFMADFAINNDVVAHGTYSRDILLKNASNQIRGSVHVNLTINPSINIGTSLVNFGFNDPSLSTWNSSTQSLPITNLRTDISQTVHVSLSGFYAGATLNLGSSEITLAPGETFDLAPSLSVNNSGFGFGIFSGSIVITYGQGLTVSVPTQFTKYYVLKVVDNSETPLGIAVNNRSNAVSFLPGSPGTTTFNLTFAGNYDLLASYSNEENHNQDIVVHENFPNTGGVTTVYISHGEATHQVTNNMTTSTNESYHSPDLYGTINLKSQPYISFGFAVLNLFAGGQPDYNLANHFISDLSSNYFYQRSYYPFISQDRADFFYDSIENGINSNVTFSNLSTDFKGTPVHVGINMNGTPNDVGMFFQTPIGFGFFPSFPTTTATEITVQSLQPATALPYLIPGLGHAGTVSLRSNSLRAGCPGSGICNSVMETPLFYPSENPAQLFNYYLTPTADRTSEGVFAGLGPMVWFGKFANDSTQIAINDVHKLGILLKRQDYAIAEYDDVIYTVLNSANQQIGTGTIPGYYHGVSDQDTSVGVPNILEPVTFDLPSQGKYTVDLTYPYFVGSQTYQATVSSTFKTNNVDDKNPPALTKLYYYKNDGLNRGEKYNPSKPNRIEFEIDPVDGTLDTANTTASFQFDNGTKGKVVLDSWASENGHTFSGKIKKFTGVTKITITITTKDLAQNKLIYKFELPVQ